MAMSGSRLWAAAATLMSFGGEGREQWPVLHAGASADTEERWVLCSGAQHQG